MIFRGPGGRSALGLGPPQICSIVASQRGGCRLLGLSPAGPVSRRPIACKACWTWARVSQPARHRSGSSGPLGGGELALSCRQVCAVARPGRDPILKRGLSRREGTSDEAICRRELVSPAQKSPPGAAGRRRRFPTDALAHRSVCCRSSSSGSGCERGPSEGELRALFQQVSSVLAAEKLSGHRPSRRAPK